MFTVNLDKLSMLLFRWAIKQPPLSSVLPEPVSGVDFKEKMLGDQLWPIMRTVHASRFLSVSYKRAKSYRAAGCDHRLCVKAAWMDMVNELRPAGNV